MTDNTIEEIKSRLDLIDIVKEYVELEKVGSNYRALCPFHSENTPSFFVSPSRQTWRCFGGCNEGGDIFEFVMRIEGIEFYEALKVLAKKAGVEIQKRDSQKAAKKDRFYDMYELATKFFQKQLRSSKKGKKAEKYLLERGISSESIDKWRLGYSPDSWQALSEFLISKGYKREEIIESGLATEKDGHSYDRFRGRIIFPIANSASKVIAFGGRIFGDSEDTAKYLNSPQTLLYDKSKVLYGLDKAKVEIRRKDRVIMVEGYTDVIMSHQAGYENVVSTSGTALTERQLDLLSRYTRNLHTAFDMDSAGSSATKKGIEMARKMDFDIRVISLPEEKDPADLITKNVDKWKEAVEESIGIMEFYFENAFRDKDPEDPKQKKEIAAELLPVIARIPNRIERSHWAKRLADDLEVDEKAVVEQLEKLKKTGKKKKEPVKKEEKKIKNKKERTEILEERIISLVAKEPERSKLVDKDLLSEEGKKLFESLKENKSDEKVKEKLDYLALRPERGVEDPEKEISDCLKQLKREKIKKEFVDIHKKIKKAEKDKDKKLLKKLTEEAYKISKRLQKHNHE